jgi:hypothetical protein
MTVSQQAAAAPVLRMQPDANLVGYVGGSVGFASNAQKSQNPQL